MNFFNINLFAGTLGFMTITSCTNQKPEEVAEQPNFIVFIADDAAWNDCGPYGNHNIKTPNINKLAEEGVLFSLPVHAVRAGAAF